MSYMPCGGGLFCVLYNRYIFLEKITWDSFKIRIFISPRCKNLPYLCHIEIDIESKPCFKSIISEYKPLVKLFLC